MSAEHCGQGREQAMKKTWITAAAVGAAAVVGAAVGAAAHFARRAVNAIPEIPAHPKTGRWYRVTPPGTRSADGSAWHGLYRRGRENKVVVSLFGGGASFNEEMARCPNTGKGGFYCACDWGLDRFADAGITSSDRNNPFRNWTMVAVPYTTGDFHLGAGTFAYQDDQGRKRVLHHNGYENVIRLFRALRPHLDSPEALVFAGFSAGGYGAALLAGDVIPEFFPATDNVTVLSDSAGLIRDGWGETAEKIWQAPRSVCRRISTDDLVLDGLTAVRDQFGEGVKILYTCSVKDGKLAATRAYLDGDGRKPTPESLEHFRKDLRRTAEGICAGIPEAGVFLWDGVGDGIPGSPFTQHTIINSPAFYEHDFGETTVAGWVMDAVSGNVRSHGLELVEDL